MTIKDIQNLPLLKKAIKDKIGFDCSNYSDTFTVRRIEVRLRANNIESLAEYMAILENSSGEKDKLNKEFGIHVTNFFRDSSLWEFFRLNIIPELIKAKIQSKCQTIRIWSAGCSSGEEPLSIAISFLESPQAKKSIPNLSIIGTDMDSLTIDSARQGIYEDTQFREMKPEYKNRYFELLGDGLLMAKPEIMRFVSYNTGNILEGKKPTNIDITFCRNTVIYFNAAAKSRLYEEIFENVNKGGFFIMGKTEVLMGPAREKFIIYDTKERVYRKE